MRRSGFSFTYVIGVLFFIVLGFGAFGTHPEVPNKSVKKRTYRHCRKVGRALDQYRFRVGKMPPEIEDLKYRHIPSDIAIRLVSDKDGVVILSCSPRIAVGQWGCSYVPRRQPGTVPVLVCAGR